MNPSAFWKRGEWMNIYKFSGRGVEVTEALRSYVTEKLEKLERFNDHINEARVTVSVRDTRDASRRNTIEVQLNIPSGIVRAEEHHADMYAAADKVVDLLERQLRKFKTNLLRHRRDADVPPPISLIEDVEDDDSNARPEIVRTKSFDLRPMMPEDAVVQMEALGHDFFVFIKADSSQPAVVYRRKDGNHGLIEPRTA